MHSSCVELLWHSEGAVEGTERPRWPSGGGSKKAGKNESDKGTSGISWLLGAATLQFDPGADNPR